MLNIKLNKKILAITIALLAHTQSYADIESLDLTQDEDNGTPISALKHLKSIQNLTKRNDIQVPFVQELNNTIGVRTLFVESHDLPIVDIQLTFNAGSARDESLQKGLYGTANMAAKLMLEGTEQYTAKQIDHLFDQLGAKVSVSAHRDMFIIRLRVLSDPQKLDPAVQLLLHIIQKAKFDHSGLNLVISNTKVGQKQVLENPSRLMNIQFYRSLYGQHPYAQPSVGTHGSIRKITPQILQTFRDRLLVAQNSNLAITGDLSSQHAIQLAHLITQSLPQGEKAQPLVQPEEHQEFNISYIPFTTSSQAHVVMGHIGIARNHPDRIALEVANRIFGSGSFSSLLSKELRIKRGLTYSASSSMTTTQVPGVFSFTYSTQQEQLMESIRVAHQTLVNFIERPISQAQLNETKEGMLYAYSMTFSSNASINAQIAAIGFYDLPHNYLDLYQQKLNQLTLKDLKNAIQKHIHADKLTLVIVANQLNQQALLETLNKNLELNPQSK